MKRALFIVFTTTLSFVYGQNNLLDFPTWTPGPTGGSNTPGYSFSGSSSENNIEMGMDPYQNSSALWKATPDASGVTNGGFYTNSVAIDANQTYRFSIWLKKTGTHTGKSYFGLHARDVSGTTNTLNFDGSANNNPYFWADDLPTLDEWYLVVAFIHPNSYATSNNHQDTGIYATDGTKLGGITITDFKFSTNSTTLQQRAYLNYDTVLTDNQFFYAPAIYEVNGQEPTIAQLIDPNSSSSGSTVWNTNGTHINYVGGNVGIGTASIPDNYALAVAGKIISEEVKVQLSGNWPDYVFEKDYDLPSLEDIQKYIEEKGHLPNIPSASEVENNGLELGEMHRLLLEKIEELTLYTLQQQEKIKALNYQVDYCNQLEQRIIQLELKSIESQEKGLRN